MGDADRRHVTARGIELAQRDATRAGIVARQRQTCRRSLDQAAEEGATPGRLADQGVHLGTEGRGETRHRTQALRQRRFDAAAQDSRERSPWRCGHIRRASLGQRPRAYVAQLIGLNGNGLRHSDALTLTERFTRIDPQTLEYVVTVNDPKTYLQPFTVLLDLTMGRENAVLPYECHEGNYMLPSVLSAERTEDKAIAEDAAKGIIRARKGIQQNLNAAGVAAGESGPGNPPR
jgi:hypothetical protein